MKIFRIYKNIFLLFFAAVMTLNCGNEVPEVKVPTEPKLVLFEDFTSATLNDKVWNFDIGNGCPNLCGWGNNELESYTNTNHSLVDGMFRIKATKVDKDYFSTKIHTAGKFQTTYGRVEVRAKLPAGQGVWPAIWMLGSNIGTIGWPKCGEIDIMEYVGRDPLSLLHAVHTQSSFGDTQNKAKTTQADIQNGFHTFGLKWDATSLTFSYDGKDTYTYSPAIRNADTWPFDKPCYLILNLAIGGTLGGPVVDPTIFPQEFVIDYVKVWDK